MKPLPTGRWKDRRHAPGADRRRRCWSDRRSGEDNRKVYSIAYFLEGGRERRGIHDRRKGGERRRPWAQDGNDCLPPME